MADAGRLLIQTVRATTELTAMGRALGLAADHLEQALQVVPDLHPEIEAISQLLASASALANDAVAFLEARFDVGTEGEEER